MAFGAGLFGFISDPVATVIHIVTALIALFYVVKSKGGDKMLTWAFVLYLVASILYVLVHLGQLDAYFTHIVETVLMLVAFILVGSHAVKCR